jgi:hypothetical protein
VRLLIFRYYQATRCGPRRGMLILPLISVHREVAHPASRDCHRNLRGAAPLLFLPTLAICTAPDRVKPVA